MSKRIELWSSGGGVQSSTIGGLICMGKLPKPDLAVIVDTEYELSTTWGYLETYVQPALKSIGVDLVRVKKSEYATVDLYSNKNGSLLIPAFTSKGNGIGKLPTYCSQEWKSRVVKRWANEQAPNSKFNMWMGFTLDEADRMTFQEGKWQHYYPLIKLGMYRNDCHTVIREMGWPPAVRSSCKWCPNKHNSEWIWQKENAPVDHAEAIEFDKKIRTIDPDLWLHGEGKPLGECDFNSQQDMFGPSCGTGMCFV